MGVFASVVLLIALLIGSVVYDVSELDRVIVMILALLGFSWIWGRTSLNGIAMQRVVLSDRMHVGEIIREEMTFETRSRIPKLWVEVQDHTDLVGYDAGLVLSLGGRGSRTWVAETVAVRRGRFRLGPVTVRGGDPLGLFPNRTLIPIVNDVLVFPPRIDVASIGLPVTNLAGGSMRDRSAALASPTVAGIREYVPGDPMNRIAWSASARYTNLMVKEFDPDPTADLWLIVDLGSALTIQLDTLGFGNNPESYLTSTTEYVVAIANSLAERCLQDGRKVGLIVNRNQPIRLDADNTERQLFRISETLAVATASGERTLTEAITVDHRRFSRTSAVVVITANPDREWAGAARALMDRQVSVSAVVVDAGSHGEGDVGPLIEELVESRVHVHRYPTMAQR